MSLLRRDGWLGAVLAFVTLLLWLPAWGGGFVYDDHRFIVANDHLLGLDWVSTFTRADAISSAYDQKTDIYRPLRTLSYAADRAFFELEPAGYHLANLIWHALNVALVFWLLRALGLGRAIAAVTGLLFAFHPVQVEAVAWISGRADLMATSGVLLTLILAGRARRGARHLLWVTGLAGAFALLAKESALVLVPLVVLLEAFWPRRARSRSRWLLVLGLSVVTAAYWILRQQVLASETVSQRPWFGGDWLTHLGYAINGLGRYVQLLVWPHPLATSYPTADFAPTSVPRLLGSLVCLSAPILLAAGIARRERRAWLGCLWFLIALAPVSQLAVALQSVINERSLYLPSIGLLLLGVTAMARLLPRRGPASASRAALAGLILGLGVALVWSRIADWRTDRALWEAEVRVHPDNPAALFGLATALQKEGESKAATARLEQIVECSETSRPPQYYFALYELAHADVVAQRFEEARLRYLEIYRAWKRFGTPDPGVAREVRERLARLTERWLAGLDDSSRTGLEASRLMIELEPERASHWEGAIRRSVAQDLRGGALDLVLEAERRGLSSPGLQRWSAILR